jgi:hypothetical protein
VRPEGPPDLRKYRLGRLCPKPGHEYQQTGLSLKRGTHCVCCERERVRTRKPQASVRGNGSRNGHTPPRQPQRPALPPHLALTAFLSPITCRAPDHRYRGMPEWTLRYQADEACVMCVTQQSAKALAGD